MGTVGPPVSSSLVLVVVVTGALSPAIVSLVAPIISLVAAKAWLAHASAAFSLIAARVPVEPFILIKL